MLLLLVVSAATRTPHLPPTLTALDDVWRSPIAYVTVLTLVVILITAVTLHFISTSDFTPSLHRYKFRHDGYLSLSSSRCTPPSSAAYTSFNSPSTHRTLRVLRMLPIPRAGNALPTPDLPRAVLVWLPPLHSHVGHSVGLLQHVAYVGDAVMGVDWMGPSKAGDGRWTWESVVEEVAEFTAEVRRQFPNIPLFIGGESFGASLAMAAAIQRPQLYAGMVLLAPVLQLTVHPLRRLTIEATAALSPQTVLSSPFTFDQLSRNLRIVEHLSSDPLCSSSLTASQWSSLLSLLRFLTQSLPRLTTPFLVQHGLRDLVSSPHGTRQLLQGSTGLGSFDKRLVVHSRSWHELLHEAEYEKVVEMSVEWIMQRTEHLTQTVSLD